MKGDFEMFVELTNQELMNIDGGINWGVVAAGAGIVGLGLAIAATGGLATVPVAVILGAGTAGEIAVAGAAVGCAAVGGYGMGTGLVN